MANNNKTPFLGLTTPATGDYNWGAEINKNFIKLDQVYGGLQSSMEGLETTKRQDGFFNFIEGQEYLILNSMLVGTNLTNAGTLFSNDSSSTATYTGSEFFIAGTVKQNEDMTELEFTPSVFYCTAIKSITNFPYFSKKANTAMKEEEGYVKIPIIFSPTGNSDVRLEKYTIKIKASSVDDLRTLLSKLPRIATYQLANNTAFYVTVPARGYNNETTSTLYNKTAIYYERQLVIKYTDVGAVIFTSLNNTIGGVYVPQKEVTSNAIHFVRRPITDTSQSINAYVDPWYVYGGTWDIGGFDGDIQQPLGIWAKKADQNYYYTYIPKLGVNSSDKGTKSYSIDFYKKVYEKSPNSTKELYLGTLAKVIVEYEITNMTTSEQNLSELRVFGLTPEQIKQLMGRVTYAKETITGATDTAKLLEGLKAYVDKRISESVIQVINSDV